MDLIPVIHKALSNIRFEPGELSFLAATSKVETPIRDRLSWQLQQLLQEFNVVREWKRTDIAILKGSEPIGLLELKAMCTMDVTRDKYQQYIDALQKDEQKALKLATAGTDVFTILLASNPKPTGRSPLQDFIKYRSGIETALRGTSAADVAKSAINIVKKNFPNGNDRVLVRQEVIKGDGAWFNMGCDVLVWIFKPATP